jgi:hypothetical protein
MTKTKWRIVAIIIGVIIYGGCLWALPLVGKNKYICGVIYMHVMLLGLLAFGAVISLFAHAIKKGFDKDNE